MTAKQADEIAAHIDKMRKLHDILFEAISVIAVGVGVINPRTIAAEALENYYKEGRK